MCKKKTIITKIVEYPLFSEIFVYFYKIFDIIIQESYFNIGVFFVNKYFVIPLIIVFTESLSFGLSLKESVLQTLDTNPQIKEKTREYRAMKEDLKATFSEYYPKLDITGAYGYEKSNNSNTGFENKSLRRKEADIKITQKVFDGFGTHYAVKRDEFKTKAAKEEIYEKASFLTLQTIQTYLNILMDRELIELAKENVKNHEEIYKKIKEQTQSGILAKSNLELIKSRLALSKSNLITYENQYQDAVTKLYKLAGYNINIDDIKKPVFDLHIPSSFEEVSKKAEELNPAIKSQKLNLKSARANYDYAKSRFYPHFNIEADKGWNKDIGGVKGRHYNTTVLLKAKYNFFNGGKDFVRLQKEISMIHKANEVLRDIQRKIYENARMAWTTVELSEKKEKYLKDHKIFIENTLKLYKEEYNLGKRSLFEILDAQNEDFSANREYVKSDYDKLIAKYKLLYVMGTLLKELNIDLVDKICLDVCKDSSRILNKVNYKDDN